MILLISQEKCASAVTNSKYIKFKGIKCNFQCHIAQSTCNLGNPQQAGALRKTEGAQCSEPVNSRVSSMISMKKLRLSSHPRAKVGCHVPLGFA